MQLTLDALTPEHLDESGATGENRRVERRLVRADGGDVWVALTIADRRLYAQKHLYQSERDRPHHRRLRRVHAMAADRPYQRPRSVRRALFELRAGAGTQFDPAVVAAVCAEVGALSRPESPLHA